MTPTAADRRLRTRAGLTSAGLDSLAPRQVRGWLERVRAGALNPAESAATLLLVYRVWLVALLLKALGSGWDVAWHFRWLRDDFAPPHNVNLIGDGIAIALVVWHWYTRFGVDRLALRLMIGGAVLFVGSAPIDVINHRINGLDITSWSVTHFGLYTGTGILIAGVIRGWRRHAAGVPARTPMLGAFWFLFLENVFFPNEQQEYGTLAIRAFDAGHPTAEPSLLDFARRQAKVSQLDATVFHHFALPIPSWVYPVWITTAVVLTLLAARRSVGRRWTATAVAAAYVGWRCVLWPLLALSHFPHSTVPFLLLAAGVAVDVVLLADLPWPAEAVAGAALATAAVYLAAALQAAVLVAPPISYWSAPAAAAILALGWGALAALRQRRGVVPF